MARNEPPWALRWRSNTLFIIATVAIGLFTDLFLYGLVVPVLPFMLRARLAIPEDEIQSYVSNLLAAYAGASVVSSVPAGWVADRTDSRRAPFLSGLAALLAATVMLALGRSIAVLVVARVLQGVSAAVVWTIGLAMVLDTVGPENLGKVVGSIFSFISVGELLAPVIGGVLYEKTGYAGVFGVAAGVLALDFLMRLVVVEKKTAAKYHDDGGALGRTRQSARNSAMRGNDDNGDNDDGDGREEQQATEEDALLPPRPPPSPKKDDDDDDDDDDAAFKIRHEPGRLARAVPILVCLRHPRVLAGLGLAFVQAALLACFDATVPTEAERLFGFGSLRAGLLFVALDVPYLVLGPAAGWAVDRFGTKPAAVLGFGYMVPALVLLRLPEGEGQVAGSSGGNVVLYCALLALNGVGLAVIGSPSVVEASSVVQRYERANPGFFGPRGPYAQLYGFNSLFFCAGLTVGPVVAGVLRDSVGYGNMNLVFAVVSGITATVSFFVIGGRPGILARWRTA
ncbi:MFS general substrate transporter [Xylariaceae sp. FL0662B]|nr:MFS general substrate transporter [Xylariaceae sp. FL0662B]